MFFEFAAPLIVVLAILAPLYAIYRARRKGRNVKAALICNIVSVFALMVVFTGVGIDSLPAFAAEGETAAASLLGNTAGIGMIAAALATGMSGIGGGIAVAAAASAALGAVSENEKMFGRALIFVALAEGIALYGLIISFQILGKI
jgi:V/A-type H+-transporting ATPase subunit K